MSAISLSGSDILQINDRVLADVADGDFATITFPNDLAQVKTGKNGNTIYASNAMGQNADVVARILLGSSDDKFLTALMQDMINNFSNFVLLTGGFVKRVGVGNGQMVSDVYQCSGGVFKKMVDAKSNAEGDTEQSVAVYTIRYGLVQKSVQ